jgi:hypothetical protein
VATAATPGTEGQQRNMGVMDTISESTYNIGDGFFLGINVTAGGTQNLAVFANHVAYNLFDLSSNLGDTFQIVSRLDVDASGNETLTAWVAADGASNLTLALDAQDVGDIWQDAGDLDTFAVQTGSNADLSGYQPFDEMRFGTNFSAVTTLPDPTPVVPSNPREVRVYVDDEFERIDKATTDIRMQVLDTQANHFWLPYRGVGHKRGYAAFVGGSRDITFENVTIYSIPGFIFSVKGNEGPITFNSVHTIPKPGRELGMCSWRDVYHCQNNRGPIRFKNCTGSRSHDDTIALASQHLIVEEELTASSEFKINTRYVLTRVGDRLRALDTYFGVDLGDFTVTAVTDTASAAVKEVTLDGNLDLTGTSATNIRFVNEDSANEYSRIENCAFQGSARLRSKLTFDSNYWNGKINIKNNIVHEGGSLPHDQYYVDSVFYVEAGTALQIDAENSGPSAPTYRVENVYFDNCSVTGDVVVLEGSGVTGL